LATTSRITNYTGHYPEDLTGGIHTDGQIWSTCNMLIWDQIGREQIDRAMLVGLGMTGSSTNQEQAAAAVLQAAVDLGYSGAEVATIQGLYNDCGYDVGVTPTLSLEVTGTCPGTLDIAVTGATPNGTVPLVFGSGPGSFIVPGGQCAGVELALSQPRVRGRETADANGAINVMKTVPGGACGMLLQVLDIGSCSTSNTAPLP